MATERVHRLLGELGRSIGETTSVIERLELAYEDADDEDKEAAYTVFAGELRPSILRLLECVDRALMQAPHRRRH